MTAWKRRTEKWIASWAGPARIFRSPPVFLPRVKIVAVVGDDFAQADAGFLSSRGIDLEGLERVPGKTFFWAGVYSADMNDRTTLVTDLNVFADFKPQAAGIVPRGALPAAGEYPAGTAAQRARPDERRALSWVATP